MGLTAKSLTWSVSRSILKYQLLWQSQLDTRVESMQVLGSTSHRCKHVGISSPEGLSVWKMKKIYCFHDTVTDTFGDLPRYPLSDWCSHPPGAADGSHLTLLLKITLSLEPTYCEMLGRLFPPPWECPTANPWYRKPKEEIPTCCEMLGRLVPPPLCGGHFPLQGEETRLFPSSRWDNSMVPLILLSTLCHHASHIFAQFLPHPILHPSFLLDFTWEHFFN